MDNFIKSINKVTKTLIGTDLIFLSALGLISPVFAVFVTNQIKDGNIEVVGFATAVYWIVKSLTELPIGRLLDKKKGERDDLYFLVIGYLIVAGVYLCYVFSSLPWHVYVLQGIYGFGVALSWPAWYALFTRHIDKGKEGLEWGLQDTAVGLGMAITSALGGILVVKLGFDAVFIIVAIVAFLGALIPLAIRKSIANGQRSYFKFPWKK